ncbi:MAG TPA: ABC transporter substrate-binding protein [Streptosporangiaceae bacterium]|jgi:NitT/TauT family transport system substrate-binding protein|nr:ABC transporter substrate-binding protein [Streptosporangiaceae bacterium]
MRSNRLGRASFAAAAGLAVALLAAACGSSSGSPGSATKPGDAHIVVGALPVVDDAPLYLAVKNGYFKRAGLTVTIDPVTQSTQALPDMLHGTVDIIAGANYVSYLEAQAKGEAQLKLLVEGTACKPDTFEIAALPSSGITKPTDLAGKTVAVNLTNNIQTLTANAVLKADGVNPSKVNYTVIPFPDMVAALKAHKVDAISAVEPFLASAETGDGAKPVVSSCSGPAANFPMSGYFATQSWAQQNPNAARAFQTAMFKAQAYADANPAAVRSILPTYIKISDSAAAAVPVNDYPSTLNASDLQRVTSLMSSGGLLSSPLNVSSLLFH